MKHCHLRHLLFEASGIGYFAFTIVERTSDCSTLMIFDADLSNFAVARAKGVLLTGKTGKQTRGCKSLAQCRINSRSTASSLMLRQPALALPPCAVR